MGIDSLFVVNNRTESLIAVKHWGAIAGSEICERVFEAHRRGQREGVDGDAACVDQGSYGFFLTRGEVTYVATCSRETAPLLVIEFLSQLYDVLRAYFGESVTETTLQEHHVTLYQLLDEMLDSGIPVNTHAGGLKVLVPPPNLYNRVTATVMGNQGVIVSDQDPLKLLPLPWRPNNIKYTSNEIYLDLIETIDATIDAEGKVLSSAVYGRIEVNSRLSGMPDINLTLSNSHLIEEYSFHPSVRLSRFASDRVVSFVPADGSSVLMSYKTANSDNLSSVPLPLYIRPQCAFGAQQGRVSVVVGSKPAFEKPVESVTLDVRLPSRVIGADPTSTHGDATFDVTSNTVHWVIEKFPADKTPCLSPAVAVAQRRVQLQEVVDITASFRVPGAGVSGIKVETLQVRNEKYKPTQGVRYHTRSGSVIVRA
ncbi:predicted protein [Ostreococcus lucimarinus CCE9901]|uniref:MHD domain-containing protein n=1 Tax=Ostreococcus lucimarinus (strain CCE9901) TaxID=436017 RepID=A4S191_OSTLU|nr:predicted protein [Ostreococcus lucimarinus CCE9901]ABO97617.1 predicted protein [Ostreococcus lucimarinus CCE9901]|eukprot:XP_001419324.1 predicted protein [Ostreococcus lucimarinus CCE9901]